ncbi:uncharacterized protein LOC108253641, partial [Diaphorina citri]|uniref:Uncharacterized protein LOC108253641 n=1 Tax=Diaphorina citri TaxID=121845 RepID=A0A1S4EMR1_DIACI
MEKYNQNIERNENKAYNKIKAQNIKRRQEELEKDYIMTRLELALNTDVIQKPEMAKYILEKSQEVIKDVVEKTNENITKKLMAQSNTELIKCRDESPIGNSINSSRSHEKGNDFIKEKIETKRNMEIGIGMIDKNANINEETVKHVDNQKMIDLLVKERKDNTNVIKKDLNNISKIENVKIYRKDKDNKTSDSPSQDSAIKHEKRHEEK